jgi:uncharacterized protein (TIGR00255 family)
MTIKSMTGFARSDGAMGPISWHWEVRSVNGRGLDVRLRLPPGYEALEARIREAVAKRIVRGNLAVNLNVKRSEGETRIRLNESALRQVLAALDRLKTTMEMAPPRPEALLGIKGVLELVEPEESEADMQARTTAMLAGLAEALDGMVRAREAEGHLGPVRDQVAAIERLVGAVAARPRALDAIRQRLKEQVGRRCWKAVQVSMKRALYQEARRCWRRADGGGIKRLAPHRRCARAAYRASRRDGTTGFSRPGVQSRGQHAVLQGERPGDDAGRPRALGGHRPDARAGAEHRISANL